MFAGRSAEHQLRAWMQREGNWRFKALLAAAIPEAPYTDKEIGHALKSLARQQDTKRHLISQRPASAAPVQPVETIRPLAYENSEYTTGRRSTAAYKEPQYARELSYSETDLQDGVDLDDYMGRMLINESFTEKDVLWREQLLDTVVQGAEEAKVARDLATVIEVNTRQGDHPVRADEIFAPEIAEGAGIPFDEVDWSQQSWEADKFGLGAYVTDELIDHALVDIIDQNIRWLGAATENALNRRYINTVVDNADSNNDVDTGLDGGSAPFGIDLEELLQARNNIVGNNFPAPDTIVMHDDFEMGLLAGLNDQNLLFSNRAGDFDVKGTASFPGGLFGLDNVGVMPDGPYNGSNNWGFDTDTHIGAVMYPRDFVYIYMYRDMETKDFEDPIRDLSGANVRGQFDAGVGQASALSRIEN